MKKAVTLLVLLVIFTGCTQKNEELERGMALRSKLLQAEGCSFEADITADYGDKLQKFSMHCQSDKAGDLSFCVTAPETISGITGKIDSEGGKLTFDDVVLHFDLLTDEQLSPVSAPWILLKTLRGGYLTSAGLEEEKIHLTVDDSYDDDALQLDIWLNGQDQPVQADILYDGRRILTMTVSNFQIL